MMQRFKADLREFFYLNKITTKRKSSHYNLREATKRF